MFDRVSVAGLQFEPSGYNPAHRIAGAPGDYGVERRFKASSTAEAGPSGH